MEIWGVVRAFFELALEDYYGDLWGVAYFCCLGYDMLVVDDFIGLFACSGTDY